MVANRDRRASEYGGVPGLIQPDPHEPTPSETLMQIYHTEAAPLLPELAPRVKGIPPKPRADFDPFYIPNTEKRG